MNKYIIRSYKVITNNNIFSLRNIKFSHKSANSVLRKCNLSTHDYAVLTLTDYN